MLPAVDTHQKATFMDEAIDLAIYAQNRHNELLAQIRFLGLLAGIKGPNDTDEDVENARNAIIEALSDFLASEGGPIDKQVSENYRAYRDMLDFSSDQFGEIEGFIIHDLVSSIGRMGHPADLATYLNSAANGEFRPDYGYLVEGGHLSHQGAAYVERAHNFYQTAAQKQQVLNEQIAERRRQWWANIWNRLKSYYHARLAEIKDGRFLTAVGKTAIDSYYFVAEEILFEGLVIAIVALTGGVAALIAAALRIALTVASRAARVVSLSARSLKMAGADDVVQAGIRQATDVVFEVKVTKVTKGEVASTPVPQNSIYRKEIDVEKDLTREELDTIGEGGYGSTRPDADANEPGTNGDRTENNNNELSPRPRKDIECFDVPRGVDRDEFERQLKEQQDTINSMTADDMEYGHTVLDHAREAWRQQGGKGSFTNLLRDGKAQTAARNEHKLILEESGLSKSQIQDIMSGLDATHFLDIIAGGDPSNVGMGGSAENQRIGPAWTHTNTQSGLSRAQMLRNEAIDMRSGGLHNQKMNVGLSACP